MTAHLCGDVNKSKRDYMFYQFTDPPGMKSITIKDDKGNPERTISVTKYYKEKGYRYLKYIFLNFTNSFLRAILI